MNHNDSPSFRFTREPDEASSTSHGSDNGHAIARSGVQARLHDLTQTRSYFDMHMKTVASSPTSTLVADLSQNFHLGASPAVPTPRRSLMRQFSYTAVDGFFPSPGEPTTPGEDARLSPGDLMDTSPIPCVPRKVLSRTTSMFEPHQLRQIVEQRSVPQAFIANQQLQRPALLSRKAFSTYNIPVIPEKKASHFSRVHAANFDKENDLSEQFEASPKKTPRKFFGMDMGFTRNKDATSPISGGDMERSPLGSISANLTKRNVPVFRRTQSMITRNDEFLAPTLLVAQQRTPELYHRHTTGQLTSPISPEQGRQDCQTLPSFESKNDRLRRISGTTFASVLDGHYRNTYDDLVVIDCRFPHEFEGGHIPNAINISTLDAMDNHSILSSPSSTRTLIILHCEHSEHRAPRLALHLRNRDRMLNSHRYPKLFYPEVYVLAGGYQQFHREFRSYLGDSGYVAMNDPTHKPFAAKQMHMFRKKHKFQRTQSYTFGQDSPSMGGEAMRRESSFRLSDNEMDVRKPVSFATQIQVQSETQETYRHSFHLEEAIEDSSMMDVDTSPVAKTSSYADSSKDTHIRTHGRSSSGRFYPSRMSSF